MKIVKNILIGAGAVFILLVGLIILFARSSSDFMERNEEFVKKFTREFSQQWRVSDISDNCTNEFLSQINTPNGAHAINVFSRLGKLKETTDFELHNYSTHSNGPTVGVFNFKAQFENAKTLVTVTLHEENNLVKVHGFHVDPLSSVERSKDIRT